MNTIIVYYSLEGNTKYAVDRIAEKTGADVLRLMPVKAYPKGGFKKYFWGGKSVVTGEVPALEPYEFNVSKYDMVILATPVWASNFAPPLRTFLATNDISNKKVAFAACSAGGNAEKCFKRLSETLQKKQPIATLSLLDPFSKQKEEDMQKITDFCKQIMKERIGEKI